MALFSLRERIAIAVIALLIIAGWSFRYLQNRDRQTESVTIIHDAVPLPPALTDSPEQTPGRIDINTASALDFETLPGIGPAKAAAIVAYRTRHGRFTTIADLDNVPGIGPATIEAIAPSILVADSTMEKKP